MPDNKKDGYLDFRRTKQTQFDPGQVMRGSFSESASALRISKTNAILKDDYTHFVQELNVNNRPTKVTYYQAVRPRKDKITFRGDVGGDLASRYFTIQEPITRKTWVFYYVVSGTGVAPGIGDVEVPVSIETGDFAAVVAYATKGALNQLNEFNVVTSDILTANIEFEYTEFGGENQTVDVATSGFFYTNIVAGDSIVVGEVELDYDVVGNPIYNGNLLKGLMFNPYTASFDPERAQVDVIVKQDGAPLLEYSEVNSLAQSATATILTYTVPVGKKVRFTRSNIFGTNMGTYIVKVNGIVVDKLGTYYTKFNDKFEFDDIEYTTGTVITIEVLNRGMQSGDFNANLQGRIFDV